MKDTQRWIGIGRLGQDPKRIGENMAVFSLAVQDDYYHKSKQEQIKRTTWLSCVLYGNQVKVADHMHKGMQVCVVGKIEQRKWKGEEGREHERMQIAVEEVQFLGSKSDRGQVESEPDDQDIPF